MRRRMPQLARATASLRRPGLTWTGRCTARVSVSELRAQLSGEKPHDNGKSDEEEETYSACTYSLADGPDSLRLAGEFYTGENCLAAN
ncbi:TPA: hypothetical protein ACHXH5_000967 [Shigella sonnei]|nr:MULTISPECIES: hypothetical protein [Enterobacteriaceae]EFB2243694.1 hypothetical protein [Escherichia coli]EFB5177144.1 hypothetical protein [Escherichia coli]EFC3978680.1 hypothetical protein [Escherichia coli]EFD1628266.1 hypothetical protein [Escherichia coli]EFI8933495.1 hypothetical protein [Escherichia coli]